MGGCGNKAGRDLHASHGGTEVKGRWEEALGRGAGGEALGGRGAGGGGALGGGAEAQDAERVLSGCIAGARRAHDACAMQARRRHGAGTLHAQPAASAFHSPLSLL